MSNSFLCGCSLQGKPNYPKPKKNEYGHYTCPEHGALPYGWASQLKSLHPVTPLDITYDPRKDHRDNRDPLKMGEEIRLIARRKSNGNLP